MRYTMIVDDPARPRAEYVGVDTLAQAQAELRAHLHENPLSTNVLAEVGEPGDEHPRWVLVATPRRAVRVLRGVARDASGALVTPAQAGA